MTTIFRTTTLGYPRITPDRRYKTALERFWSGRSNAVSLHEQLTQLAEDRVVTQAATGIDLVACGDFSWYDHVLDTAVMLGCIPERFGWTGGPVDDELYFALARGRDGIPPLEMTKWFDTNYHYLVPELPPQFTLTENRVLRAFNQAQAWIGERRKPLILGPFTFLTLTRLTDDALALRLAELTPIYAQILTELRAAGAEWIQIDEPALVGDVSPTAWAAVEACYRTLAAAASDLRIILQTAYGDLAPIYPAVCALPVAGIGLDFVRGRDGNLAAINTHGFPADKVLVAGIVDGRNVWRTDLDDAYGLMTRLATIVSPERIMLAPSCSLLHLPDTLVGEKGLPEAAQAGLCFARERLDELMLLALALRDGIAAVQAAWDVARARRTAWLDSRERRDDAVRIRSAGLRVADWTRLPFTERWEQQRALNLPLLPTTTIGSFPQTAELRQSRAQAQRDPAAYQATIKAEIARVIALQEELGLDVLVHGEPERNDMVQFFADHLAGCLSTQAGWVQSYGSRCVRPPIIYGDVARLRPMTVKEARFAQSLTRKPVKGMLTGPVTILQWSFVRNDLSRAEVATQIALAVRDEAADLEQAGLSVIQIDEPAFREGLPLRRADWPVYLEWAVRAFRIASSSVSPKVQIHTHMCYSDFSDTIAAITALDADVISIEDARSNGEMLQTLQTFRYPLQVGPGVYDIHSPNIPTVEAMAEKLAATLACLPIGQVWVNPDCGLKTRRYEEVIPALRAMVAAARQVRATQTAPDEFSRQSGA